MEALQVWSSSNLGFLENTLSWGQLEVAIPVSRNRLESIKPPLAPILLRLSIAYQSYMTLHEQLT